jgi:hypothetical protein
MWFAIALVLVPLVVNAIALVSRVGDDYFPYGDRALLELRTRDIGSWVDLLGQYSRFRWFHPGPAIFYLFAPVYRLTGSHAISLGFAALLLNGACLVGILFVARRRGGTPLLVLTLFLVTALMHGLDPQFLRDYWNPYITALPFLLLILLAWSMACGETWALPLVAGVASLTVQTHVGYTLLCVAVSAVGLLFLVFTRPPSWKKPVAWTVGVLGVLWSLPLVEQFTHNPGNLDKLIRFFRDAPQGVSFQHAWRAVSMQLGVTSDWFQGQLTIRAFADRIFGGTAFPFVLVALLVVTWVAWRWSKDAFKLDVIVLVAVAVGVYAVTRIVAGLYTYLVVWTWSLGMAAALAVLWSLLSAWKGVPQWVYVALAAGAAVLAVFNCIDAAEAGNRSPELSDPIGAVSRGVKAQLPPGDGVVLVRGDGQNVFTVGTAAGVANELERDGIDVKVVPGLEYAFGRNFAYDGEPVRATVLTARQRAAPPGYTSVGTGVGADVFVKPGA